MFCVYELFNTDNQMLCQDPGMSITVEDPSLGLCSPSTPSWPHYSVGSSAIFFFFLLVQSFETLLPDSSS